MRKLLLVLALAALPAAAFAFAGINEVITHGGFEEPAVTGTGEWVDIVGWEEKNANGPLDSKLGNDRIPGAEPDNQVLRLKPNFHLSQPTGAPWQAGDLLVLTLNGHEAHWRSDEGKVDEFEVLIVDTESYDDVTGDGILWSETVNVDGTREQGVSSAPDWKENQTFSYLIDTSQFPQEYEGGNLTLRLDALNGVAWADNISLGFSGAAYGASFQQQPGVSGIDVDLSWMAGKDYMNPGSANDVNPAIADQYVYVSNAPGAEPNFVGAVGADPGQVAESTYQVTGLGYDTEYQWQVVEVLDTAVDPIPDIGDGVNELQNASVPEAYIPSEKWSFVTMSDEPVFESISSSPDFPEPGDDVTVSAVIESASSVLASDINWSFGGIPISEHTFTDNQDGTYTTSITVEDVSLADSGEYTCSITGFSQISKTLNIKRMLAHWKMDSDAANWDGTYLLDVCTEDPVAYNADPNDYFSFVDGAIPAQTNQGITWNGQVGGADVPGLNPLSEEGDMTITGWVHYEGNTNGWGVIAAQKISNDVGNYWRIAVQPTRELSVGGAGGSAVSSGTLPLDDWCFIAAVYDSTESGMECSAYIISTDGSEMSAVTDSAGVGDVEETPVFSIGRTSNADEAPANMFGKIDDMRVFNYALSEEEIAQQFYDASNNTICDPDSANPNDVAGPEGLGPDCSVDMYDFAAMADSWLSCSLVPAEVCDM
ncbi:LamG-like jellyroll fold domain-containing protein [Sedimentisphaera salicampi]|uniref:LamG-like jellyroll fold domain-containing protein n=1 Tax=Sedimentisphaera salicampi TaxID=1941349 RepID=UPI000B9B7F49|nr:LamG-like jellyroll fold domain-containing protein [Sedimentisphaera salicampi]OXU15435.1 hypothetical protein SMSP1_00916 [Sedimentisphaera salicampi]